MRFGVEKLSDTFPSKISQGEKQRVECDTDDNGSQNARRFKK